MNQNTGRRPNDSNLRWMTVHTVTHEESGLSVQVSRLDLLRPKYSIAIGRALPPKDDKPGFFSTNISMRMNPTQPWNVTFLHDFCVVIADITKKAQEWIALDSATKYLDTKADEEEKVANFNRKNVRVTGKTAKKKEKLAQSRIVTSSPEKPKPAST